MEFYRLLLERVPDASIAGLAAVIVREEERHLQFQRHWVERTLSHGEFSSGTLYPVAYQAWYMLIQAAAVLVWPRERAQALGLFEAVYTIGWQTSYRGNFWCDVAG